MNIFYVDSNPLISATQLCDRHVIKMGLESTQMICTTLHHFGIPNVPYKKAHYNHPCTIWVRQSLLHYNWLVQHAQSIFSEYSRRYGKVHKSQQILEWCINQPIPLTDQGFIAPPQCMPVDVQHADTVIAYQNYYNVYKNKMAKWDKAPQNKPNWYIY